MGPLLCHVASCTAQEGTTVLGKLPSAILFLWDQPIIRNRGRKGVLDWFIMLLNVCFLHVATQNLCPVKHVYRKPTQPEHQTPLLWQAGSLPPWSKLSPSVFRDHVPQTEIVSHWRGSVDDTAHGTPRSPSGQSQCATRLQGLWEVL